LYNACLEERREAWKHAVSRTYYDQANQLKDLRLLCPDVASVNFSILQAVCRRAHRSYEAFYHRCKAGRNPGTRVSRAVTASTASRFRGTAMAAN
jgi:hypothetical protein